MFNAPSGFDSFLYLIACCTGAPIPALVNGILQIADIVGAMSQMVCGL